MRTESTTHQRISVVTKVTSRQPSGPAQSKNYPTGLTVDCRLKGPVLCSRPPIYSAKEFNMKARLVIALLLLSFGTGAFAAEKKLKQSPSSNGILISSTFEFSIQGDGISTTFSINPWKIPQSTGVSPLPFLPLAGVSSGGGGCTFFGTSIPFTASVSGRRLQITLQSPPDTNTTYGCIATLLFQPE